MLLALLEPLVVEQHVPPLEKMIWQLTMHSHSLVEKLYH